MKKLDTDNGHTKDGTSRGATATGQGAKASHSTTEPKKDAPLKVAARSTNKDGAAKSTLQRAAVKTVAKVQANKKTSIAIAGAALAAGFAAYYLMGERGAERRSKAADWMREAQRDVANRLSATKSVTVERYNDIVDSVSETYAQRGINKRDVTSFRDNVRSFWQEHSELTEQAKQAGLDIMVLIAEKLRESNSPQDAKERIKASLKAAARDALERGAEKGRETTRREAETSVS